MFHGAEGDLPLYIGKSVNLRNRQLCTLALREGWPMVVDDNQLCLAEVQVHAVRNWCYLCSAADIQGACRFDTPVAGCDADGYKILCRSILTGAAQIVAL